MKSTKKWQKGVAAAALGAVIAGAPLFAAHAEEGAFSREGGHRYDVRRGMYEQPGDSGTQVAPGKYAEEGKSGDERDKAVEEQKKDGGEEQAAKSEESNRTERTEKREYRYDVRRGMYEQSGGSDTQIAPGQYADSDRPAESLSR